MAIGDPYATLDGLKAFLRLEDSQDDGELVDALNAASRHIENWCQRQFNKADEATPRTFTSSWVRIADVADFYTRDGLVIETDAVWETGDYDLEPADGVVDGLAGWPFSQIVATGGRTFPRSRGAVRVTAKWGWPAVPAPVKAACLLAAAELFKLRDAPFGVAGYGDYGAVRVRDNPKIAALLAPYRVAPILVA